MPLQMSQLMPLQVSQLTLRQVRSRPARTAAPRSAIFCEFCGEHVDKPQLEKTLIAERTPVDFGENTEILLDDPVIIGPTLRLISEEASTVNGANDISVPATPFVIGRSTANADHAIDARGISRKHVQIDLEDGIYYITDLNSTNGVLINGSRISPMERTILEKDDTIKIGERVYRVEFSYSHEQRAAV